MHMPGWKSALLGVALVTTPISAHAEPADPAAEVTAERLASAQRLMAALMPAEQRDAMIEQMITAIMANFTPGIKQRLEAEGGFDNPEVVEVFDRFIARQTQSAIDQLKTEMPNMIDAMSRAYARRLTVAQMNEIYDFFSTPTGRLYMAESMGIMSDPDIAAWQRDAMTKSMDKLPEELEKMQKELQEVLGRANEEKKA